MKRILIVTLLAVFTLHLHAQDHLKQMISKLDVALVNKDSAALMNLLHADLTYGHSNGWVEKKHDVIRHIQNGKLSYSKINSKDDQWIVKNKLVTVRLTSHIEFILDGTPGSLDLHVLQVWVKKRKSWQLIARQSTKINATAH